MSKKENFLNKITGNVSDCWIKYGILPSVMLSQAILESGWGESQLTQKANNLFGIKADSSWKGAIYIIQTTEYVNDKKIKVDAKFRKYNNWNESIVDHAKFININKRYSKIIGNHDYKDVCKLLQSCGYATNPNYADLLISVIESNNLTKYDVMDNKEVKDVKAMSVWKNKYINPNKFSRPQEKLKAVRKIVIHWTANYGATAMNHFNYFNNLSGRYASAHLFVDKNEALCIIPLNEITYHANDGTYKGIPELKPNANYLSIGVEMCVEKDGTFHKDMIARTEDVVVELCKMYNLNPLKDIVRHFDITKKSCPTPWVKNPVEFTNFKERVNNKLKGNKSKNGDELTMSQYAEIMKEIEALKKELNKKADTVSHTDVAKYAKEAFDWAVKEGLIVGNPEGMNASGVITREQFATVLHRYHMKYIKK